MKATDELTRTRKPKSKFSAVQIIRRSEPISAAFGSSSTLHSGDSLQLLTAMPERALFDLVITSPPYNLGKSYEERQRFGEYLASQSAMIDAIVPRLKNGGSICWQIGNYIENGHVDPLDFHLHPIFKSHDLVLRNRIIWRFGHGLHCRRRFSGRYEVILWYTKGEDHAYTFNLDAVRIPSKYPGKRHYKGPSVGKLSCNPRGKNPEDVWDIPNVKGGHLEKTIHPCQFPVGLAERLILSLSNRGDLVLDPYCGVGSTGVAAALHGRRFIGSELKGKYVRIAQQRIVSALSGSARYRPHDVPVFDHRRSPLSISPFSLSPALSLAH
jgi:adenine-specific DNA-methyltransferase